MSPDTFVTYLPGRSLRVRSSDGLGLIRSAVANGSWNIDE